MHADVGRYAAQAGIDCILCVGGLSEAMYEGAVKAGGAARYFETREALQEALPSMLRSDDTILVKASHSMAFEKVVEALKNTAIN